MPVRSKTLMAVPCLASAARAAISHVGVSIWISAVGFRSLLVRQYSSPVSYQTRNGGAGFSLMPHTFCQSCESRRNCGADPLVRGGPPRPPFCHLKRAHTPLREPKGG